MSDRRERRTLQERVGVSMNSSTLRMRGTDPGAETALERVAALGAAGLHVHHGADRLQLRVAAVVMQPAHKPASDDALAAELASLLWHIRYAGQHGYVERAGKLFAYWMRGRGRLAALAQEERDGLLGKLAMRALHEWLSDRCIACGGSGKLEKSRTGSWIRPRGSMQRNATFRVCTACDGSRRQATSHSQRVTALGISRDRYDSERWDAICKAAVHWLGNILPARLRRPLTLELEKSTKRS